MPCRIELKEFLTDNIRDASEEGLGMAINYAKSLAVKINKRFNANVVSFSLNGDYVERQITVPDSLIDRYYNSELKIEEQTARNIQIEDADRAGEDYTDDYMFQTENLPSSTSSPETLNKVKEAVKKMGISIQTLADYVKNSPNINTKGINGLADLLKGVIAVTQGMENTTLTEEMVHIATSILEQTNPKLITELISKIDRFKIYKLVLNEYGKKYTLPNGRPDIRKIKKEAVDKLITELIINNNEGTTEFPELMEEANRSMIRSWWNSILDFINGMYRKANIDIFNLASEKIINENIGTVEDINSNEIYYQLSDKQKDIQQKLLETNKVLKKVDSKEPTDPIFMDTEEANNWYEVLIDGKWEKVKRRVTDRVKQWYKQRFPGKTFTAEEKEFNEFKRKLGVTGHNWFQEIHNRWFDENGNRRTSITSRSTKLSATDEAVYNKLETYYAGLINKFSEDGKTPLVFSEVMIYDSKEKEAGTLDLLIIEESGRANIIDWKFMSMSDKSTDIAWYKQGAYNIQLGRYKDILIQRYGIKEIGMNRAIPIIMDFKKESKNKDAKLILKGINIGSVNINDIEDLRLIPVSEESETTGHLLNELTPKEAKQLDELLKDLNAVYKQINKKTATSDELREFKSKRLNIIKEAIRMVQGTNNIAPLVNVIEQMRREGEMIINDYTTIYENASVNADFTNKQLSDFAEEMREYMAMASIFGEIPLQIGKLIYSEEMEKDAKTKEEKAILNDRKELLNKIRYQADMIKISKKEIDEISKKFADKYIGIRNLVTGLLSPKAIIKGLSATFRGISELPLPSLQILFKLVEDAKSIASQTALGEVNRLLEIRKALSSRGGDLRKLVQQIYQKDDKDKLTNKLIYKYDKAFYDGVKENAKEENQNLKWLKDNIDVPAYILEADKHMKEAISYIEKKHLGDDKLIDKLTIEEREKWDINNKNFSGWDNYIIKRHPLAKWYSKEYIELSKDADLLNLYNFISEINNKAKETGYIQNKGAATFLPFIRKSMAEGLTWDFDISVIKNWGESLSARADDVGYGAVNTVTGELEYSIPKYYTSDFTRTESGENDYSDVSEDLFKNMILYINHLNKYQHLSDIEGQLQLVKTIETFKNHLRTNRSGDIISERGKPEELPGNAENAKLFDDFFRALLYEQKYPLSDIDIPLGIGKAFNFVKQSINNVAGTEVFNINENPTATSLVKVMDAANRWFQLKTLGFEAISGAVNAFGGNIQIATQAGNYFKAREVLANEFKLIGNKFKNDEEREMFVQLIDKFMPLKDDPTYEKLRDSGMSVLTRQNFSDILMVFMRQPEQHIEKSIFLTLLQNMMIEDGKIVSIREFVKNKYPDRAVRHKELSKQINSEIEELKKTRSIDAIKKLEDGKLVIPGLDLSHIKELQRLTSLTRRISRNATGAISNSDLNRMGMNIWTKSMMVFKNWIPKLVDTRFSEFRRVSDDFSVVIDEEGLTTGEKYDIGRIRLWAYVIGTSIRDKTSNIYNILSLNEKGLKALDLMYEDFAEKYKERTGEELNMTKEDFIDLIRTNLQNQMKELAMLLSLTGVMLSLGFMTPPDDDRASKNFYRWSQRVVDKFITELSFFYNPVEFQRMLSGSAFPAIGVFKDIERFISHLIIESTGYDISNPELSYEEVKKKAQPIKNAAKMFPISKSVITYISLFDSDFAKEFDITVQKQNNMR